MRDSKPILLVEDDEVDAMTVQRALQDIRITNRLDIASDGEAALEFLRDDSREKPGLILLDLNMPRMTGAEFLQIVKADEWLRRIPVVVLTTSREESDLTKTFSLGVAGYMLKPVDYLQFVEMVRVIGLYWTLSELPG